MTIALVDNGSLVPAAHRHLRAVAAALSSRSGTTVHAVSWKHSDRLEPAELDNMPACTLEGWIRTKFAAGERDFLIVPLLVSTRGAIASAILRELEALRTVLGEFRFRLAGGIADKEALSSIVADRIRDIVSARRLERPPVIVVDHGGPSPASAALRDRIVAGVGSLLRDEIGPLAAASMEGADHAHNRPLLEELLGQPPFDRGDVVLAPLFLSQGRHAGHGGDLARIADAAADRPSAPTLRCHFTELPGTHPMIVTTLADALRDALRDAFQPSPAP